MPAKKKSRIILRGKPQGSQTRGASATKSSAPRAQRTPARATRARYAGSRSADDLWIAPRTSLSRQDDEAASWSTHPTTPRDERLLELADIALGLRKSEPFRKRKSLFLSAQNKKSD